MQDKTLPPIHFFRGFRKLGEDQGRLDAYFDTNDRRWFITNQSVELAIAEEKAKAVKTQPEFSETSEGVPKPEESSLNTPPIRGSEEGAGFAKAVEQELVDLKIVNRGKDYFIDQLKMERESLLGQLINASHKLGELETRLLQLGAPPVEGTNKSS